MYTYIHIYIYICNNNNNIYDNNNNNDGNNDNDNNDNAMSAAVRNLRIREDTAKYLLNLDVNSARASTRIYYYIIL